MKPAERPGRWEPIHRWVKRLRGMNHRHFWVYYALVEAVVDAKSEGRSLRMAEVVLATGYTSGHVYLSVNALERLGVLTVARDPLTARYVSIRLDALDAECSVGPDVDKDQPNRRKDRARRGANAAAERCVDGAKIAPSTARPEPPSPISLKTFEIPEKTLRSHTRPVGTTDDPPPSDSALPPSAAAEPPPVTALPEPAPDPEPAWVGSDPTPEQVAGWEALKGRRGMPGSPGWDAMLNRMAWRDELARRAFSASPPLTPRVAAWTPPSGPPTQTMKPTASASPVASQGLSRVCPGVGTEDLLRRLVAPGAGSDAVAAAAARVAEVHDDARSLAGYLAVFREVVTRKLLLAPVLAAYLQAGKPGVRKRGAVFMHALAEHRAKQKPPPRDASARHATGAVTHIADILSAPAGGSKSVRRRW